MRISLIRNLITASWMVSPQAISVFMPLFRGLMMGLEMERETPMEISFVPVSSIRPDIHSGSIAISTISGLMLKHDQECGPVGTRTIARKMMEADRNPEVIGHVLVVESGGGASNSVPEIANAISSLTKPIVGYIDGAACSAGMYAVSYCPHIIASNSMDMVGCIGAMIEFDDFPKFHKTEDGAIHVRVYADQSSEKNLDFESALGGDFSLIKKNFLNPITELFIADMRKNRPSVKEDQLHGATYFAKDAVGTLIDEIGTMESAFNKVIELHLAGLSSAPQANSQQILNTMPFTHLEQIPSCRDIQLQEGAASLNEGQLTDIDTALASASRIPELKATVSAQSATIADRDRTIAERDARIVELEHALESGVKPAVTPAETELDPLHSTVDDEDPIDYCRNYLKNRN